MKFHGFGRLSEILDRLPHFLTFWKTVKLGWIRLWSGKTLT